MAFPRVFALAEVVWSAPEVRDWDDFRRRLPAQLARLDALGVGYRQPAPALELDAVLFVEDYTFAAPAGTSWVFTDDGSAPTAESARLAAPLRVTETTELRVASSRPGGKLSAARTIPLIRADEPSNPRARVPAAAHLVPGLWRTSAPGARGELPAHEVFAGATRVPVSKDELRSVSKTALRYTGFLQVDEPGIYTLVLGSDDGSVVELAGHTLVANGGQHAHLEKRARVLLPAGTWPFDLRYFDAGGAHSLSFALEGPGAWRLLRERP